MSLAWTHLCSLEGFRHVLQPKQCSCSPAAHKGELQTGLQVSHHESYFSPELAIFAVAGKFPWLQLLSMSQKQLSGLEKWVELQGEHCRIANTVCCLSVTLCQASVADSHCCSSWWAWKQAWWGRHSRTLLETQHLLNDNTRKPD